MALLDAHIGARPNPGVDRLLAVFQAIDEAHSLAPEHREKLAVVVSNQRFWHLAPQDKDVQARHAKSLKAIRALTADDDDDPVRSARHMRQLSTSSA